MKNEHNREELWGGRETAKYPVTLPVDVLLNPIHFAWSLSFNVQNIHICWPGAFQLHLLVGLIKNVYSTVENPVSACPKGEGQESTWENLQVIDWYLL